jgi:D-psicose/D-tagatose/L-ribulose 3-epimerase
VGTELDVACHLNVLVPDVSPSNLGAALDAIASAGYRRVVLPPLDPDAVDVRALRAAISGAGLAPITIAVQHGTADVSSADAAVRAAGLAALRAAVELTHALGGDQMNGVPYGPFGRAASLPSEAQRAWAAEGVGAAANSAHEAGITMTFEVLNRYETAMVNTADQAVDFMRMTGSEHVRIHLDTFHMGIEEADIAAAIRTALPYLGYLELGQSGRGPLDAGSIDVSGVVRQAIVDGYTGRWGVEAFSRSVLSAGDGDMLAVWRATYDDGVALAVGAQHLLRQAWAASVVAPRKSRIERQHAV